MSIDVYLGLDQHTMEELEKNSDFRKYQLMTEDYT